MQKEFEDFIQEVRRWEIGLGSKSREELILWGRTLAKKETLPAEFVAEYDFLLQND